MNLRFIDILRLITVTYLARIDPPNSETKSFRFILTGVLCLRNSETMKKELLFEYIHQGIETRLKNYPLLLSPGITVVLGNNLPRLVDQLNNKLSDAEPDWNKVDKEIISLAQELNLDQLAKAYLPGRSGFYDLMTSFSNSYVPAISRQRKGCRHYSLSCQ